MAATMLLRRAIAQKLSGPVRNSSSHGDPQQIEKAQKMWKNLTLFGVPVALLLAGINVKLNHVEQEPPEFIPYEHLRIRTKRFPWGDGNHTLFHNPHMNPLPTGYEH